MFQQTGHVVECRGRNTSGGQTLIQICRRVQTRQRAHQFVYLATVFDAHDVGAVTRMIDQILSLEHVHHQRSPSTIVLDADQDFRRRPWDTNRRERSRHGRDRHVESACPHTFSCTSDGPATRRWNRTSRPRRALPCPFALYGTGRSESKSARTFLPRCRRPGCRSWWPSPVCLSRRSFRSRLGPTCRRPCARARGPALP